LCLQRGTHRVAVGKQFDRQLCQRRALPGLLLIVIAALRGSV